MRAPRQKIYFFVPLRFLWIFLLIILDSYSKNDIVNNVLYISKQNRCINKKWGLRLKKYIFSSIFKSELLLIFVLLLL